ncbi:MAG: xylose isomerase [Candidatus Hydrogenedentota bacterium]|nr:MAG: xylose isomerase [Candidatus Hydrogenedentota bacterium]
MGKSMTRRTFIKTSGIAAGLAVAGSSVTAQAVKRDYSISLAGWSLHRAVGRGKKQRNMLDMPQMTSEDLGIHAIELVNQMMSGKDKAYIDKLAANASKYNTKILLIMIDSAGNAGAEGERGRASAVTKHGEWIDVAADLGCHSVRMNWGGAPKDFLTNTEAREAFIARSVPTFQKICEHGDKKGLNVIIENHWGPSSYPEYLIDLIKRVDHPRFGTLPDFGNFPDDVDNYDAVDRMMPYAKAVSAKCYDFDDATGMETKLDYDRLIKNVVDKHGYHGYIGIEYEGNRMSEYDGILACRKLLEKFQG